QNGLIDKEEAGDMQDTFSTREEFYIIASLPQDSEKRSMEITIYDKDSNQVYDKTYALHAGPQWQGMQIQMRPGTYEAVLRINDKKIVSKRLDITD
ncbi:hypothetical protein KW787_02145, partial [Candidatus Pacearchaeota archaeon]|nr:hypothetical protein [Candidatus Pacearchaeota archaeon]